MLFRSDFLKCINNSYGNTTLRPHQSALESDHFGFQVPTTFFYLQELTIFLNYPVRAHRSSVVDPTLLSPTHTPAHNAKNHNTKILPDICHSILPDPIQNNFTKDMTEISSQHSEELDNRNIFNENSKLPTTALLFK